MTCVLLSLPNCNFGVCVCAGRRIEPLARLAIQSAHWLLATTLSLCRPRLNGLCRSPLLKSSPISRHLKVITSRCPSSASSPVRDRFASSSDLSIAPPCVCTWRATANPPVRSVRFLEFDSSSTLFLRCSSSNLSESFTVCVCACV